MYLYRFMSIDEFNKFMKGETLINNKEHTGFTNSVGFCFGKCDGDNLEDIKYDPKFDWQYLEGAIEDPDICCIFEVDEKFVNKGWGRYADPYGSFWDSIRVDEYSTTMYNNKNFKLIAYCTNFLKFDLFDNDEADWEWIRSDING